MKLNRIISNGLVLSMLISNYFSNISLASSNYHEHISGKILNINDTFSEDIEEIDVFGESIQNPNDLSDIKSVGDLYVDDKGDPILDKEGNKQYIIKLTSRNINLLNEKDLIKGVYNYGTIGVIPTFRDSNVRVTLSPEKGIPIKSNSTITCKSDKFHFAIAELNNGITLGDTGWQQDSITITTKAETTHITFNIKLSGDKEIKPQDILPGDIMLYYGDETIDLHESISNQIEIILPHQLQKVGDVSDKLYYDKKSKSFVVEKNIEDLLLNGSENWYAVNASNPDSFLKTTFQFGLNEGFNFVANTRVLSTRFKQHPDLTIGRDEEAISIRINNAGVPTLYIRINQDELSSVDAKGFKAWLKANNTLVKYQLDSPKISRIYTSKDTLQFYEGQTNLFIDSQNSIQPTIKVKVNRLKNLAVDAINDAIADSSIANIESARYLVNQMKESLLKDSLQNKLNEIYAVSDLVVDKKTVTANTDLYIKSKNILSLSIDTNSITFKDFNGVEDYEINNAVIMTIDSSLPYEIKTYLTSPIQNKDSSTIISPSILSLKESSKSDYNTFTGVNIPIILSDNNPPGNKNAHNLDFKLNGGILSEADVYKTTIKLEVNQK